MAELLIIDDHALLRTGFKRTIEAEFRGEVRVQEAATADEALQRVRNSKWDVIVLDMKLPDANGLELLREFKSIQPQTPILVLSAFGEDEFGLEVFKRGASGFVQKESHPDELIKAIRTVLAGGKHISPAIALLLAENLRGDRQKAPHENLSARELEVLSLLASGKTPTEVAKMLSLSIKTVSTYRTRMLEKMNLKTTAQLIHYAIKHRLVPDGTAA